MALYFLTGSRDKVAEMRAILGDVEQLDIDLPEVQEIDAHKIIEAKLVEAQKHHQGALIVEDTSLYLDALGGLPGPLIKWFMKTVGNEGLFKMVQAFDNYGAEAKTIMGYADGTGGLEFFEGTVYGTIVEPRGAKGFGWDPIFEPRGTGKTFAELSAEEKNTYSMRRLAAEKLKEFL